MNSLSVRKKSAETKRATYAGPPPLLNCPAFLLLAAAAWCVVGMLFVWITS